MSVSTGARATRSSGSADGRTFCETPKTRHDRFIWPKKPMTIIDPTALHSSKRSIVSKASQWTIDALAPLREHLSPWPAVLPSAVGDQIRPLKIGVHSDLAVL